jgi:outer membrane protein insertion porin family
MSSSRGERAAAPARFAAAVTAARDDARARFEKAITSGKRMTRRLRVPRRANPTCVASISSSAGAGGGADSAEPPDRPSAKALVHAPAEGAGGVRFVSNDDPVPSSADDVGVDVSEPSGDGPSPIALDAKVSESGGEEDTRPILISSVDFEGESPELEQLARSVVRIKPNFSYTVKEIEADVVRVFNTGVFREVRPETVDTRDGISLTFKLAANPVIRGVVIKGCDELPASYAETLFKPQFGKFLNSTLLIAACSEISKWYDKKKIPVEWYGVEVSDGILELGIEEPRIGDVEIRFIDRKTGEPNAGATRPEYITRHLKNVKPGKALHGRMLDDLNDLINTAGLENANITWNPRRDRKPGAFLVDAVVNVTEKTSAGFSGGGGISAKGLQEGGLSALIANADYFRRNLFGRCQTLTARVEVSPNNLSSKPEIDVKIQHSDPWIGDAGRTSRRIFLDSDSSALDAIYAKADSRDGDAGDDADGGVADITDTNLGGEGEGTPFKGVFVKRVTSGVEYRRPLAACWTGSVSATYQRASTHDDLKQPILHDAYGAPLTFSGLPHDTTCNILMRFVYEGRGKDEAQLVVSAEQAVPVRPEMLAFNRVLVRAQRDFRVGGARLTVAAKGGNVIGDLPPYEAFSIGGASSVRGYPEGGVGTGRKFIVGSAEMAVPLAPDSINGCVFFDIGSDLKSGVSVLGDPGGTRGKPGQGYGYGAGVVALTPIGPVRLEYAFSDKGVGRMHCGLSRSF